MKKKRPEGPTPGDAITGVAPAWQSGVGATFPLPEDGGPTSNATHPRTNRSAGVTTPSETSDDDDS